MKEVSILLEYINKNKYADANITELYPSANNEWKANEAKMLSKSIKLTVDYVVGLNLPNKTYFLYPEFLKKRTRFKDLCGSLLSIK